MTGGDVSSPGKERLERALIRISRNSPGHRRQGRSAAESRSGNATVEVAAPVAGKPEGATADGASLPEELLELVDRLDSIADRLADLEHPGRPLPATKAIFSEWVRLRKWEEMTFAEFLTLRRAGRV